MSYIPTLSSLNLFCSSRRRDPGAVVRENRRRLALRAGFHPRPLRLVKVPPRLHQLIKILSSETRNVSVWLCQVNHGRDVWVLGRTEPDSYDAMVTDRPGVVLAAPGADCMPILFADPRSKVIAVAHAGDVK